MTPFFEWLQQGTILKRAYDEFEKNPRRMMFALFFAFLFSGGGVAAYKVMGSKSSGLSELPVEPAEFYSDGTIKSLPQSVEAEKYLAETLRKNDLHNKNVLTLLERRGENDPVSQDEIDMISETGKVEY